MRNLSQGSFRWLIKNLLSFLVILAIVALGGLIMDEFRQLEKAQTDLKTYQDGLEAIKSLGREFSEKINEVSRKSASEIQARIERATKEKQLKDEEKDDISKWSINPHNQIKKNRLDLEIKLLDQEIHYLSKLLNYSQQKEALRLASESTCNEWNKAKSNLKPSWKFWGSGHTPKQIEKKRLACDQAKNRYKSFNLDHFQVDPSTLSEVIAPLNDEISKFENIIQRSRAKTVTDVIGNSISTALVLLTSVIFLPILLKLLFYFVLAPLAAKCHPICILPDVSGDIDVVDRVSIERESSQKISSVSINVTIDEQHELFVLPEYLQSSTAKGRKTTKWVLNWAYPITCLASGMALLTHVSPNKTETVVLSSSKDPLIEIGIVSIPAGSAIVFQPHNLIGVVSPIGMPVRISKHWKFNSLHAWLTLQLRYLVFHGPADLIVKGCRGVRIEKAEAGRIINQNATLGFSANLNYSTTRCETFISYFLGEQELLNDGFSGNNGFFAYEEIPNSGKGGGIGGRGLEGVVDSILKIFGI